MKNLVLSLFLGESLAQVTIQGACPTIVNGWDDSKGTLDITKITGNWRSIYADHEPDMECVSLKLKQSQTNSTQLELMQGSFYDIPELEALNMGDRKMVYDDSTILSFNNKDQSSFAAMHVKGEDEEQAKQEYLA
jgi:hypothetical protein